MRKVICIAVAVYTLLTNPMATTPDVPAEIEEVTVNLPTYPSAVDLIKAEIHATQWNDRGEDTTLQVSQEDAVRLMKLAYAEGATEGVQGQYLIMRVVMNRVASDEYPNTIKEVIEQPSQFETWENGKYQKAEPSVDSHLALAQLEKNSGDYPEIIAFEATWNNSSLLRYYDVAFTYKGHTFYKKKD